MVPDGKKVLVLAPAIAKGKGAEVRRQVKKRATKTGWASWLPGTGYAFLDRPAAQGACRPKYVLGGTAP
jgi:hypothetical protein